MVMIRYKWKTSFILQISKYYTKLRHAGKKGPGTQAASTYRAELVGEATR